MALLMLSLLCFAMTIYGQTFTRITSGPVVNDQGNSFHCSWSDYSDDGYLDLYFTNYVNEDNFLYKNNKNGSFTKVTDIDIVKDDGNSISGSWGDYDNDGKIDLFVTNRGQKNCLYHNNGDGTFNKVTEGAVVNDVSNSMGCSWGDYDNDGFLDLFVANFGPKNFLYHNNGDGTFEKVLSGDIVSASGTSTSCGWCDYDNDGDLDLFVTNWAQVNILYRNNGNGTFVIVNTVDFSRDTGNSIGCSWADYDNDGDFDLFVVNSFEDNFLYRNNGDATFTKILNNVIISNTDFLCSSSWGDIDNDGDQDLFITNWDENPSKLFINNGDGTFKRQTTGNIVSDNKHSVGSSWGDYDNDGDLDLAIANDGGQDNLLYQNNGNNKNWLNVKCIGITSNTAAIGAVVKACTRINYTAKTQTQIISGQTGFASQNSLNIEFGLGDAPIVDSLIIDWPSGVHQVLPNVAIKQFLIVNEPTTYLDIPTLTGTANSTLILPINVQFPANFGFYSAQLEIGGYFGKVELTDIISDSSLVGNAHWIYESNQQDSTLSIWFAGAQAIRGNGVLCHLQFDIPRTATGLIPVRIESALFNTGEVPVKITQGGINVLSNNQENQTIALQTAGPAAVDEYVLSYNYPNPFNPTTTINYALRDRGIVQLSIFNQMGHLVRQLIDGADQPSGNYAVVWDGRNETGALVASGLYFYTLRVDEKILCTHRMTLIK